MSDQRACLLIILNTCQHLILQFAILLISKILAEIIEEFCRPSIIEEWSSRIGLVVSTITPTTFKNGDQPMGSRYRS